jgi:hypothetical protein
VAATTGTQVAPAPDAGYTGLYAVTVANGQTTITSGSIAQLATAPFFTKLPALIPAVQAGAFSYAVDTSGSANTIAAAFTPPLAAVTAGQELRIKVANTNTGAVVINPNGLGNISATMQDGSAILPGTLRAGGVYSFISDGTRLQLQRTNNGSIVSFSSGSGTVGGTATAYLGNNSISSSTENNVAFIMPFDYRLSRLYGYPGSVPTMGSRTYTVRVNGADTAVTATASGVTPAASDLTHGVTGVAGDQIDIKLVTSGSDVDIHKVSLMLQQLG